MLDPKADRNELRSGYAKTRTRIKMQNQAMRMLFFVFSVLLNPVPSEVDIFILITIT